MTATLRTRDAIRSRQFDTEPEDWRRLAECTNHDPELWFGVTAADEAAALSICRSHCPVLRQCRALADQLGKVEGIWAGETGEQRRLRRNRQRPRRAPQRVCVECGTGYDGPRYRYCSDACALYCRLAESTKERIRQEAHT